MSLFDIADEVYHYKDAGATKPSSAPAVLSSNSTVPTLFLLDETLQHLHKAREKAPLIIPTKQPFTWKYTTKHNENDPCKPLRNVFSNSLLEAKVNDTPQKIPLHEMGGKPVIVNQADDTAKGLLKAVTEACEAFERRNHPDKIAFHELMQNLEEKLATLNTLASTPFVALVRKKISQKLTAYKLKLPTSKDTNNDLEAFGNDIKATLNSFKSTSNKSSHPQTHPTQTSSTILDKLLKLPKAQLERLPKAQQELVEFSKRYQQALSLPSDKLAQLPLHQQQLVVQLQNKKL